MRTTAGRAEQKQANAGRLDEAEQHFRIASRLAEGDNAIKVRKGLEKIAQMRQEREGDRKSAPTWPAK